MTRKNDTRDRWLNSFSWLWLSVFGGLGAYLMCNPDTPDRRPAAAAVPAREAGFAPDSAVAKSATRNIEEIRVGMRVLGNNPDASEVDTTPPDPDAAHWRKLSLRMTKGNGDVLSIELLRPLEWLSFYEVAVGRTIDLDLSEMGAEGPAEIFAVEPCPPIQPGRGNVVTGTFAHRSSGNLINLQVTGEPRPIGVTRNHRYWSEDREEFVAAGDLRVGERLQAATGQLATVVAITPRPADEPVYNLEVHQQHVYLVGNAGILVHNAYPIDTPHGVRWKDPVTGRFVPAPESRLVIGRLEDLKAPKALRAGEYTLLPQMAYNLGSPAANWKRNSSLLRQEMKKGVPIRDGSVMKPDTFPVPTPEFPDRTIRQTFAGMERNLLRDRGWTLEGEFWHPPAK